MNTWTPSKIREFFDSHPNLLLSELSRMTGFSVRELKKILMS